MDKCTPSVRLVQPQDDLRTYRSPQRTHPSNSDMQVIHRLGGSKIKHNRTTDTNKLYGNLNNTYNNVNIFI